MVNPSFEPTAFLGSRRLGSDLVGCWTDLLKSERHRTAAHAQSVLDRAIKKGAIALIADAEIFRVEVSK